jgi:hypothetical protein
MSTIYEPGTVVMGRVGCEAAAPRMLFRPYDDGMWIDLGGLEIEDNNVTDIRPLVVIDPKDDEQVQAIARAVLGGVYQGTFIWPEMVHDVAGLTNAVRDALAALAARPPMDEPQEWGARVADANGKKWLRVDRRYDGTLYWLGDGDRGFKTWEHIPQPARLGWDEEADQ